LAADLMLAGSLAAALAVYRIFTGRELTLPNVACRPKHQFRIWQLLVLTAEIAVQIAIIRALVAWNREGLAQLRDNIASHLHPSALFFLLVATTLAGGALFIVLHERRWFVLLPALLAWPVALTIVTFLVVRIWPQLNEAYSGFGAAPRPFFGAQTLTEIVRGWAIEANLVISLLYVRYLGYEFFRPLPRRGGRQSSEATSAP
jgi:CRISPR/Cas system-associated protein Csm6